ncbi:hypothetical protein J6590_107944 [Homalodisca vitripennis]|nr:hypothetical protein J6590_107704 [Homalodisca vitripennis]KAG8294213.1 hypothetical protein J6590_107944 [Homalodisca vitripennis]
MPDESHLVAALTAARSVPRSDDLQQAFLQRAIQRTADKVAGSCQLPCKGSLLISRVNLSFYTELRSGPTSWRNMFTETDSPESRAKEPSELHQLTAQFPNQH